jgi:hypothetical protein
VTASPLGPSHPDRPPKPFRNRSSQQRLLLTLLHEEPPGDPLGPFRAICTQCGFRADKAEGHVDPGTGLYRCEVRHP